MARRLTGRVVIATHNKGKLWEMRALLAPHGVEAVSAGELGLPEPEETGSTFIDKARLKALAAVAATGLPALADDSGLCVDALDGAPGVYSADWAGEPRDFGRAMDLVEAALQDKPALGPPPPRASFHSTLVLAWPDGHEEAFEGRVDGVLVFPRRGDKGFGYDPIFLPDGQALTFGEMMATEKNAVPTDGSPPLSHRARAFVLLRDACLVNPKTSAGL